jgi:hypothetical protein
VSSGFRSFVEATIPPKALNEAGNIRSMTINTATGRVLSVRERAPPTESELALIGLPALIERTRSAALIDLLRVKLGFPREVFERAVHPVIERYAQIAQLRPAPEPHAYPGGLFVLGLELGSRALDYRRGQILPRGAAPEAIGAHAHRWTYAVFVVALLHVVGRNAMDVSIKASVPLLDQFVPSAVRGWLNEDASLMRELVRFLSEEASVQAGAIGEIVLRAARASGCLDLVPVDQAEPPKPPNAAPNATTPAGSVAETAIATDMPLAGTETEFLEDVEEPTDDSAEKPEPSGLALAQAPDCARRFIAWLRQGLGDGTLLANRAGAFVHFVDEGMLLVSPRIFREFAKRLTEDGESAEPNASGDADIGKVIQRQVLRAGWHVQADRGVNILTYQIMRGDRPASRLSGVVIPDPGRFIEAVPPANPLLVRLRDERAEV